MMQPTEDDDGTSGSSTDAVDVASCGNAGGPVELPLHLTEKILRCINPLESACFATVCKCWAATVAERLARPVPHLFIYLPADNTSDRRGLVVPMHGGGAAAVRIPNRVRLADTNGLACVGAMPSGHLAFANWWWGNDHKLVLVNPITGTRQSIGVGEPRRNPVLAAGDGGDSFISVGADGLMLCWRAGGGEEWRKWTVEVAAAHWAANLESAAMCNGCFYMLDKGGYVFTVDVAAPPPLRMEKLPVVSLFDRLAGAAKGQLLAADGEVLFVRPVLATREFGRATILCRHDTGELHSIVGFEVYRLDVKGRRWTKVEKLVGDRTLFVSPESTFVVRSSETEGCRSNCIYFVGKAWHCSLCNRDDGNTWGVYSMEDRKVLYEHAVTGTGSCSRATWFLPNVA